MTAICCAQRPTNSSSSPMATQPFDGDLDDYKDWLFKNKLEKAATCCITAKEKKEASLPLAKSIPVAKVDDKEQRKRDAEERQRLANVRKPIEAGSNVWKTRWPS
jgi:hypothetical protein